jgi:hypothetical protein
VVMARFDADAAVELIDRWSITYPATSRRSSPTCSTRRRNARPAARHVSRLDTPATMERLQNETKADGRPLRRRGPPLLRQAGEGIKAVVETVAPTPPKWRCGSTWERGSRGTGARKVCRAHERASAHRRRRGRSRGGEAAVVIAPSRAVT